MFSSRLPKILAAVLIFPLLGLVACAPPAEEATEATAEVTPQPAPSSPPWERLEAPADLPTDRPLNVGFLIIDGVYNTELTAPYDIFQHTIFHTDPGMTTFTVAPAAVPVKTFEGLILTPQYTFADAPPIDILVVPSAEHNMDTDLENVELIDWVRETGENAHYVISLCDGAFVLAKAGLLEGRAVTTFPGDQDTFAEMFPELDLRRGVSFVHDGKALTSEGGAKSFDVAMYVADHLYGEKIAQNIGRGLIIDWPPTSYDMSAVVVAP